MIWDFEIRPVISIFFFEQMFLIHMKELVELVTEIGV